MIKICLSAALFVPIAARAECILIGDSIAYEVARFVPECRRDAWSGLRSDEIIARVHPADVLVVSAGTNDWNNPDLEKNLRAIRSKASAKVVWISPDPPVGAAAVRRVAKAHGDRIIRFAVSDDKVHPASYAALADQIRASLK